MPLSTTVLVSSSINNRLPRRHGAEIIAHVTEGKALPKEIADQIVDRTDGIPLHALVQEAAYSTLLRNRRQQLHAQIASTLEGQFPEIVATRPALIAQHCAEAGLDAKAVDYWLKAGQQAVARSSLVEAGAQFRRGLT